MTNTILSVYPNCSRGGMTTVFRNRALSEPETRFWFLFENDRGGADAYSDLPNVEFRIVKHGRLKAMAQYTSSLAGVDEVRVTSAPEVITSLAQRTVRRVYEFHSSDEGVIQRELARLDLALLDQIVVPSRFLASFVQAALEPEHRELVSVVPNLVDPQVFGPESPDGLGQPTLPPGRPLVWIGRFDKGKNPRDFLRLLSLLPPDYYGVIVVSFEDEPSRMADILGEASTLGVRDRLRFMVNLTQAQIAALYRASRDNGGLFCSTSLGESFGYGVAEALTAGLRVVGYDVGALSEVSALTSTECTLVPVGDLHALVGAVRSAEAG